MFIFSSWVSDEGICCRGFRDCRTAGSMGSTVAHFPLRTKESSAHDQIFLLGVGKDLVRDFSART